MTLMTGLEMHQARLEAWLDFFLHYCATPMFAKTSTIDKMDSAEDVPYNEECPRDVEENISLAVDKFYSFLFLFLVLVTT